MGKCLCEAGEVCHHCLDGKALLTQVVGGDGTQDLDKPGDSGLCTCRPYQLCRVCAPERLAILVNARFALVWQEATASVPRELRQMYSRRMPQAEDN